MTIRIIDVHTHFLPLAAVTPEVRSLGVLPEAVADGERVLLRQNAQGTVIAVPIQMVELDRRLHDMETQGVGMQFLSPPPSYFRYDLAPEVGAAYARGLNAAMIQCANEQSHRFRVLGTLPLQDMRSCVEEVRNLAREDLVVGVEIEAAPNGMALDDAYFEPLWDTLVRHDLGALVHPDQRSSAGLPQPPRHYMENLVGNPTATTNAIAAVVLGGVLARHSTLRLAFVHGGGYAPYQVGRWDHGWKVRQELSHLSRPPREYLRALYFDTITHDPPALRFLGEQVGWGRVLLGSDYPFDMGTPAIADTLDPLDPHVRARVAAENAAAFAGARLAPLSAP